MVLDNGKEVEADVVVFGTGWKKEYPYFNEDVIVSGEGGGGYNSELDGREKGFSFLCTPRT